MKNNGFTLVELLAVILILSLLTSLAVISVTTIVKNSKEKLYATQILSIQKAAESWGSNNLSRLPKNDECIYLTIRSLKDSGLLDEQLVNPLTNEPMDDNTTVKISTKSNALGYVYEVNADTTTCKKIYDTSYLTPGAPVYFDVEAGNKCSKEEYESSLGSYQTLSYNNNSVVSISVTDYGNSKTGYNGIDGRDSNQNSCLKFYVVKIANSEVVSLLLDHDIGLTSYANESSVNGPILVLSKLKQGTDNWNGTNVPNNYSYVKTLKDASVNYTINYAGYKARLITIEEVDKIRSSNFATFVNDSNTKVSWLYERLFKENTPRYQNGPIYNASNIMEPIGYWTASTSTSNSAFAVKNLGDLKTAFSSTGIGIRPVIEVSISDLMES